jgi:hypothetical protein
MSHEVSFALRATDSVVLGAVGAYGIISPFFTRRTRDHGIRIALGLAPGRLVPQVMGRGIGLVALGSALGVGAALLLTRMLSSLLATVGRRLRSIDRLARQLSYDPRAVSSRSSSVWRSVSPILRRLHGRSGGVLCGPRDIASGPRPPVARSMVGLPCDPPGCEYYVRHEVITGEPAVPDGRFGDAPPRQHLQLRAILTLIRAIEADQ